MAHDYDNLYSTNNAIEKDAPPAEHGNRNVFDCAIAIGARGDEFILGTIAGSGRHTFARFDRAEAIQIRDALSRYLDGSIQ